MIKINGTNNKLEEFQDLWGKAIRFSASGRKEGVAPRLFFYVGGCDDEKQILIELSFTKEEFDNMELNQEEDITKEITDIGYSDNKGWLTLIDSKFTCSLTKIDDNKAQIKFNCKDDFEDITIEIDEIVSHQITTKE